MEQAEKGVRGNRLDNIPNDVAYCDLTAEQLAELDEVMKAQAEYVGWRLHQKTNGGVDLQEARDDILFHIFLMRRGLEKEKESKKGKTYNVVAYLKTGVNHKYYDLLDKYYDWKIVQGQLGERLKHEEPYSQYYEDPEDALLEKEDQEDAEEKTAGLVTTIRKAARMLGVRPDFNDWVSTAMKVINEGIHKGRLKGSLRKKVEAIRQQLEGRGYQTRYRAASPDFLLRKGVSNFVRSEFEKNRSVTSSELFEIMRKNHYSYNKGSVKALLSVTRRKAGMDRMTPASNPHTLTNLVARLWDSGIQELKDVQEELAKMGKIYKPSVVRAYVRKMRNQHSAS